MYNLTPDQKNLLRWLVQQARNKNLPEEFTIIWVMHNRAHILGFKSGANADIPDFTKGALDALANAHLILCDISYETTVSSSGARKHERSRRCTLLGQAYEAVDSDFSAPDVSFVKHLTPLADITNLDTELKQRCLPILGAGSTDPKLWDSVVRTAGVILEERLHDVGGIADNNRIGRDLVNDVFGAKGTLATKIPNDSERQGYRDIYAGIVGVFRNPYAHRLVDPTPEDGGAFVVFVNLLLKMLEDLRLLSLIKSYHQSLTKSYHPRP
jgi:hypothetical protein